MASPTPRRYRRLPPPAIMVAPIVDIVFTLLIFIMLVSRFLQPALEVELPGSTTATAIEGGELTIVLDEAGRVYLNNQPVTDALLAEHLRGFAAGEVELVHLRADAKVGLQRVVEVLDLIRASSVKRVALEARAQ